MRANDILDRMVQVQGATLRYRDLLSGDAVAASANQERQIAVARTRALEAGLQALDTMNDRRWGQVNLKLVGAKLPEAFEAIVRLGDRLAVSGQASNLWFLHKPPGIRLRLETVEPGAAAVLAVMAERWVRAGLFESWSPAVYEPETFLFGGPISMSAVHAVFTADSRAWLRLRGSLRESTRAPVWAVSLVMLRSLFTAFGVADWEDLDVWERVVKRTGRSLPSKGDAEFADVAIDIRDTWERADQVRSTFPIAVRRVVDRHAQASVGAAAAWTRRPEAEVTAQGPRALLALLVIFHWNRAGLNAVRQAILAEALLRRPTI